MFSRPMGLSHAIQLLYLKQMVIWKWAKNKGSLTSWRISRWTRKFLRWGIRNVCDRKSLWVETWSEIFFFFHKDVKVWIFKSFFFMHRTDTQTGDGEMWEQGQQLEGQFVVLRLKVLKMHESVQQDCAERERKSGWLFYCKKNRNVGGGFLLTKYISAHLYCSHRISKSLIY